MSLESTFLLYNSIPEMSLYLEGLSCVTEKSKINTAGGKGGKAGKAIFKQTNQTGA